MAQNEPQEPEGSAAQGGRFQSAFQESNKNLHEAIQSLSCLQERVQSFASGDRRDTVSVDKLDNCPSLQNSVAVIQTLIADTKQKCDRMTEDNSDIVKKLDGKLERCQVGMDHLRKELDYAHRCVSDLEVNLMVTGSATESDNENQNLEHQLEITIYRLREDNSRLKHQVKALQRELLSLRTRQLNDMLHGDCDRNSNYPSTSNGVLPNDMTHLQRELNQSREALLAMKQDRKRLKSEKCELLNQMKEVYRTLEDKERELRDFIRQYDQRMRDSDKGLKELLMEKEEADGERNKLVANLSSAESQIYNLQTDIEGRDLDKRRLEAQLAELQGRFVLLTGQQPNSVTASPSVPALHQLRTPSVGYGSLPVSPASIPDDQVPPGQSPLLRSIPNNSFDDPQDAVQVQMRPKTRSRRESASQDRNRLSRLFGIGRSKSTGKDISMESDAETPSDPIAADLNLAAKADELIEARKTQICDWRQAHIQAWLDLELGFGSQIRRSFAQNVKSGKVLLSLTDNDLSTLGVTNAMHKKKLKLAIEEYRAPGLSKFPGIREVTWQYVSSHFVPACGLQQHIEAFRSSLVDGRILNNFNKKHLSKYLGVQRKLHQLSVLKGVELLRRLQFDVKLLSKRRADCERQNTDLVVWSAGRLQRWLEQIDLHEYAKNLDQSGLHGALAVLEPSFSANSLATALGIPSNKQMVRNHLNSEFTPLLIEARSQLDEKLLSSRSRKASHSEECSSTSRSFTRSCSPGSYQQALESAREDETPRRRAGLRGSFGKVFGLRSRRSQDDCTPERPSLSSSKSMPDANFGRDTGTMSSTTSDLGSSMERSQHMRTIMGGTPQVLVQAPLTETNGYGRSETSQSADSAVSVDLEPSPPKTNGVFVKMRSRSAGRRFVDSSRPHSIAEFGSPPVMGVNGRRAKGMSSLVEANVFSSEQLQTWLSASDFKSESLDADGSPPTDRRIGPISEQTEPDAESDVSEFGRSPGPSPGRRGRPQSLAISKSCEKKSKRRSAGHMKDFDVRETDL